MISKAGEQAADDDQRERPLGVGADAGRERRRKQAERGDERGHHDRPQPQDRGLADRPRRAAFRRGAAR